MNKSEIAERAAREIRATLVANPDMHDIMEFWEQTITKVVERAIAESQAPHMRSDKDYAVEHGGYLADAAAQYMKARNVFDEAESTNGCDTADHDLLRALENAIGEFRKRAKRAKLGDGEPSPPLGTCDIFKHMPHEVTGECRNWRSGAAQEVSPPTTCKSCRTVLYRTLGEKGEYCDRCESREEVSPPSRLLERLRDGLTRMRDGDRSGPSAQHMLEWLCQEVSSGGDTRELKAALKENKKMNDEQIKHMVERFLSWRLPENFNPDGGISFKPGFNEHTSHPMKNEPVGTNLFDYTQAEAMVRYLVEGLQFGDPRELKAALNEQLRKAKGRIRKLETMEDFGHTQAGELAVWRVVRDDLEKLLLG